MSSGSRKLPETVLGYTEQLGKMKKAGASNQTWKPERFAEDFPKPLRTYTT